MSRQSPVTYFIDLVQHEVEQIESGDERWWEINVLGDGPLEVVLGADWVGSGENRGTGIECGDNPSLGDRNSLLFLQ